MRQRRILIAMEIWIGDSPVDAADVEARVAQLLRQAGLEPLDGKVPAQAFPTDAAHRVLTCPVPDNQYRQLSRTDPGLVEAANATWLDLATMHGLFNAAPTQSGLR
jgi:hypothetical protein